MCQSPNRFGRVDLVHGLVLCCSQRIKHVQPQPSQLGPELIRDQAPGPVAKPSQVRTGFGTSCDYTPHIDPTAPVIGCRYRIRTLTIEREPSGRPATGPDLNPCLILDSKGEPPSLVWLLPRVCICAAKSAVRRRYIDLVPCP